MPHGTEIRAKLSILNCQLTYMLCGAKCCKNRGFWCIYGVLSLYTNSIYADAIGRGVRAKTEKPPGWGGITPCVHGPYTHARVLQPPHPPNGGGSISRVCVCVVYYKPSTLHEPAWRLPACVSRTHGI